MRHARRLLLLVAWLALFDVFVPRLQDVVEFRRYERGGAFRFENSDLFALGPLVAYLRDHPRHEHPRVAFFGNSIVWGYGLTASTALPAWFQKLEPDSRVYNVAVNGFELGNAYLISKATIDSVDRIYVQLIGKTANPTLASLIPVSDEDVRAFQLRPPDRLERRLQVLAGAWRLYGASYRIQAAVFGSSSRQYMYLHKGDFARAAVRYALSRTPPGAPETAPQGEDGTVEVIAPRAPAMPSPERQEELRGQFPLLWQFEELVMRHRKRAVFLQIADQTFGLSERDVADLNARFAPFGEIVRLTFPAALVFDGLHFTGMGSYRVAEALARHEQDVRTER